MAVNYQETNKRITVFGKFRSGDNTEAYVFTNKKLDPQSNIVYGRLNPLDLFHHLKPELRCVAGGTAIGNTLTVGGMIFNAYSLMTPLQAITPGNPFVIGIDSPLLQTHTVDQTDADPYKIIQKKGAGLFEKLLGHLDVAAHFFHTDFAEHLFSFSSLYVRIYATDRLRGRNIAIDPYQWNRIFMSDHQLTASLINYLCACPQDELTALDKFKQIFKKSAEESNQSFKWGWKSGYLDEISSVLPEALEKCKQGLYYAKDDDPVFKQVAGTKEIKEWFGGYPDLGLKEKSGLFTHYYKMFLDNSNEIHKIIRNSAEHSFLFCWLASKYAGHGLGNPIIASDEMYKIGIEAMKQERIRGESNEELERNEEIIRASEGICKDTDILRDDNYKAHLKIVQRNIIEAFQPSRRFTRENLVERCEDMFIILSQMCEGKVSDIHREIEKYIKQHMPVYQAVLRITKSKDIPSDIQAYIDRFKKESEGLSEEARNFVNKFIEDKEDKEAKIRQINIADTNPLSKAVKESFVGYFAESVKSKFASEWSTNKEEIKAQKIQFENAYRFRLNQEVNSDGLYHNGAGTPAIAIPLEDIPNIKKDKDIVKKRERIAADVMKSQENYVKNFQIKTQLPEKLKDISSGMFDLRIKGTDKKDDPLAKLQKTENQIIINNLNPGKADQLLSEKSIVATSGDTNVEVELAVLQDIPELKDKIDVVKKDFVQESVLKDDGFWKSYSELLQNKLTKQYRKEKENAQGDTFLKKMRSLILGEYMLSTPSDQTNLNMDDLSNILGIMLDMVDQIGNSNIEPGIFNNFPTDKVTSFLKDINLSKYYPVEDDGQMSQILTYHYELCQKLIAVQPYLDEIGELKSLFEALQGNNEIEIRIINKTLTEHVNGVAVNSKLFLCEDHPLFVYLTGQSDSDINAALTRLKGELHNPNPATPGIIQQIGIGFDLQLPIFVSKDANVNSDAFPIINPNTINLPDFSTIRIVKNIGGKDCVSPVNGKPFLFLCASLMVSDVNSFNLGKFVMTKDSIRLFNTAGLGSPQLKDQNVSAYLKDLWKTHNALKSNLIFTKWFNLALLEKSNNPAAVTAGNFGIFLAGIDSKRWQSAFSSLEGFLTIMQPKFGNPLQDISSAVNKGNPIPIGFAFGADSIAFSSIDWKNFYNFL